MPARNECDDILADLEREKRGPGPTPRIRQLVAAAGKGDVARVLDYVAGIPAGKGHRA